MILGALPRPLPGSTSSPQLLLLLAVTLRELGWPLLSGSCWYEVFEVASQSGGLTEPSDWAVRLPGSRASRRRGRRRRGRQGCWEKAKEEEGEVVGRT